MLKTNFHPSEKHLADIKNWLIKEWNETKSGFYCNWNIIEEEFAKNNVAVITENDFVIGFLVYRIYEFQAIIDIAETKPTERKKGIARKLINDTLDYFGQKGVLVCELFCSPENSEPFWKRIGFENFPDLPHNSRINMFKPLVETLKPTEKAKSDTKISLWNCEPYQADREKAKWNWDLNFADDNKTLTKPIIFPVSSDWQVELTKNGQKIVSEKVKRFRIDLADNGSFMIIRKLTALKNTKHNNV
ncbi:GNAT family N-acetyltransferase [Mangrovimonas cancribranchiae]|uniref:GNAT family N-acetyltransferase n=1 Tax=Mangrovimonas cancribranchiae TaxID=3080055 RepID=A0AAU6NYY8_9FLAO